MYDITKHALPKMKLLTHCFGSKLMTPKHFSAQTLNVRNAQTKKFHFFTTLLDIKFD